MVDSQGLLFIDNAQGTSVMILGLRTDSESYLQPIDFTILKPRSRAFLTQLLTHTLISTQVSTPLLSTSIKDLPDTHHRGPLEEVIIKAFEAAHCPLHFLSEEHGELDLNEAPDLLGVLDGLDGSSVYASQRGIGRYGTMLGIFSCRDPQYKDYLSSCPAICEDRRWTRQSRSLVGRTGAPCLTARGW